MFIPGSEDAEGCMGPFSSSQVVKAGAKQTVVTLSVSVITTFMLAVTLFTITLHNSQLTTLQIALNLAHCNKDSHRLKSDEVKSIYSLFK